MKPHLAFFTAAVVFAYSVDAKGSGTQPSRVSRSYGLPATAAYGLGALGGVMLATGAYHAYAGEYRGRSYKDYYMRYGLDRDGYDDTSEEGDDDGMPCWDRDLPDESLTVAWITGQIVIRNNSMFNMNALGGLEVDLYRDLSWRSQCLRPTQVVVTLVCKEDPNKPGQLADADYDNPAICTSVGTESSRSLYGRGRTLLAQEGSIVEFSVGVESDDTADTMQDVVDEMLTDPNGVIHNAYSTGVAATPSAKTTSGGKKLPLMMIIGIVAGSIAVVTIGSGIYVLYRKRQDQNHCKPISVPPSHPTYTPPVMGIPVHGVPEHRGPQHQFLYPPPHDHQGSI